MLKIESYFGIYLQYFKNNILILIIAIIGGIFLLCHIKEIRNRKVILYGLLLAVMVAYNEKVFSLMGTVKEDPSYYRLLWILPVLPCAAYCICRVGEIFKSRLDLVLSAILLFGVCMLGYNINRLQIPENIYCLNQDVLDIADAVEKDRMYNTVNLVGDRHIMYGIREYNAHINLPFGEYVIVNMENPAELYSIIEKGEAVEDIAAFDESINMYQVEYLAVKKEYLSVNNALELLNKTLIFSNEDYNLYRNENNFHAETEQIKTNKSGSQKILWLVWRNASGSIILLVCFISCVIYRRKKSLIVKR